MIDGLPLVSLTPSALLALTVLLVLTDRLVWYKRLQALEKQIDAKDARIAALIEQNGLLLQSAVPTVNSVLGALHQAADMPPREAP